MDPRRWTLPQQGPEPLAASDGWRVRLVDLLASSNKPAAQVSLSHGPVTFSREVVEGHASEDRSRRFDIAVPAVGYKNHVGIDRRHGLIRT